MTDLMSINAFWTLWLLVHLILAVGLVGALTHQAMAVALPVRQPAGGIVTRFRAVPAVGYATAVCVMWVLTFIVGSYIYTKYRIYIRIPIEQARFWRTHGFFDFKEHVSDNRSDAAPGVLVFLEKCPEPRIRHGTKDGDRLSRRYVLVPLHRRSHLNNTRGFGHEHGHGTPPEQHHPRHRGRRRAKVRTFAVTFSILGTDHLLHLCSILIGRCSRSTRRRIALPLGYEAATERRRAEHDLVRLDRDDRFWSAGSWLSSRPCSPKTSAKKMPLTVLWLLPSWRFPY